jgi:hypothetical protein
MPRAGVSVLPNEPDFLEEGAERVADDRTHRPRDVVDDRTHRTREVADDRMHRPREEWATRREQTAVRDQRATARGASGTLQPVRAPRIEDRPRATEAPPARRTVTIRGQVSDRYTTTSPRRPDMARHERPGFRPDRVAMWAVLLGFILVLVAATSAHAALLLH